MKKLVEMVKMFILSMVVAVMMIPAMTCQALDSRTVTFIKPMIGTWYDTNGNPALTIDNNYKINGCTVLASYWNDNYECNSYRIDAGNGTQDIALVMLGEGYHKMILVNNQKVLRWTRNPQYFESVGGIYLGMDKNQVVSLYGQPSSRDDRRARPIWKYNREGMELKFVGNVVESIIIYPSGDRRFDWSGLSANSSNSDFAYKYNVTVSKRGGVKIGYGEAILLYNDRVELTLDTPMIAW